MEQENVVTDPAVMPEAGDMTQAEVAAPPPDASGLEGPMMEVPEKFRGPDGQLRADTLLKSYLELERKVGSMLAAPADPTDRAAQERLFAALGRPKDPAGYVIEQKAEWLERDTALEERLHAAGLSNDQAQLVYDLAAERIEPLVEPVLAEAELVRESQQQRARLEEQFGGSERFAAVAQQLKAFGERHIEPAAYQALSRSFDGVMALHAMMRAKEPDIVGGGDPASLAPDPDQLTRMMRDPRYWRDRDKDFVARVTDGYRRLYGS
ncbi:MAG TPA: hypothetical protein VHL31_01425 [Geminicoccus sp.]|jgi:hypothetical protein|uniref:capsid assembly protein n=1 Tax=Geminicoccus sp. TaxID=2024832 RepID=UPI002E3034B7|nr:hypothetical protein [Geminicoccus sp.]HEX2524946.1 hypothetical protein [Geminicoccus sp.]